MQGKRVRLLRHHAVDKTYVFKPRGAIHSLLFLAFIFLMRISNVLRSLRSLLSVNPPIRQAFAADLGQRGLSAGLVRRLAMRKAEVKLRAVTLQVGL